MNIELRFLQKAIEDKNYISFMHKNKNFKKIKPLKLENLTKLITDNGEFEFSKISKFTVLKDKF